MILLKRQKWPIVQFVWLDLVVVRVYVSFLLILERPDRFVEAALVAFPLTRLVVT